MPHAGWPSRRVALPAVPDTAPSVAVAIPAFNEADGIGGFLQEIDALLFPHVRRLRLVVVDDCSTDATAAVVAQVAPSLSGELELLVNPRNLGHGPTVLRAYRHALQEDADYVLQVDGDGQFAGSDLRRTLVLLRDEAHAVCGVRRFRQDPWFRMTMTRLLRVYVTGVFAVRARDANCPLRGYESDLLRELLDELGDDCLVPNLYLTVLAASRGVPLIEVDVSHRVRRGTSPHGSTWGQRRFSPVPWRLVRFSLQALRESMRLRETLRS
jgi:glycosyltransferase involved in cell wall biosynthesis